jgi:glycosyltransferase involved in cell wall biosynthesis
MYCGACHRDAALFRILARSGHELLVIPLYTPLRTDEPIRADTAPIFMGGISLFLAQSLRIFQYVPSVLLRLFDRPALLRGVSRLAIQTAPAKLGGLTLGVLQGTSGPHAAEIQRLVQFLKDDFRPDIVNLTNALLLSLASPLREALKVPVVCTLQGEESFIEALPDPYREQSLDLMRRHAAAVDRFVCCAQERVVPLAAWLNLDVSRVTAIHTGIDPAPFARGEVRVVTAARAPVLGYLSSIRPEKGLDILVEAFRELTQKHGRGVRLAIAGQILDKSFWRQIQAALRRDHLDARVTFHGELDLAGKVAFLHACDLFVMPTRLPEQRALAAMEALAAGVPVIASRRGVLPELLAETGGGITFEPGESAALAQAVMALLDDPQALRACAEKGPLGIATHFAPMTMAQRTIAEFARLLEARVPPTS